MFGDGDGVVVDFTGDDFFGETLEYFIERVPELDFVGLFEGTSALVFYVVFDITGDEALAELHHFFELAGLFFDFLVIEELLNKFPAWVFFFGFRFFFLRALVFGDEHSAFDNH